jgi:hypothetical protein
MSVLIFKADTADRIQGGRSTLDFAVVFVLSTGVRLWRRQTG